MAIHYVFDVDGTLTDNKLAMDPEFKAFFLDWMKGKNVHLATGSKREQTIKQIGEDIWNQMDFCYHNLGNVIYKKGKLVSKNPWEPSDELLETCRNIVETSMYPTKAGRHIVYKTGMLNVSTIGRDCTREQRLAYNKWDKKIKEREKICEMINKKFGDVEATISGQISLDIIQRGKNKSRVRKDLDGDIWFFADQTQPGGCDHALVEVLRPNDKTFQVSGWKETKKILENL